MTQLVLHARDVLPKTDAFLLIRSRLDTKRPRNLHGHDFYELIWVQNGTLRHHLPGDRHQDLTEGDMIFIRPGDTHALQGRGEDPLCVSLILRPGLMRQMGKRYDFNRFFWSDSPSPPRARRNVKQLSELNHAALRLEQAPRSALEVSAFLLPLLADLQRALPDLPEDAPDWLIEACHAAQDPAVFREGAAGFVRAAGRSHPHVTRSAQLHLGLTPTEYVNTIRMDYAGRALTGTADNLNEIAATIGLPNMSHFHRLFRAHHGLTPKAYRRTYQHAIVQP